MRLAFVIATSIVCLIGCDGATDVVPVDTDVEVVTDEASGAGGAGAADMDEIVETILPGQNGVKVVVLCKAGDHSCDEMGDPCSKYGDSCDFSGDRGVCGACCDGERGELRCSRIE